MSILSWSVPGNGVGYRSVCVLLLLLLLLLLLTGEISLDIQKGKTNKIYNNNNNNNNKAQFVITPTMKKRS